MGQLIEVEHVVLGDVAIFDTDRSLSGQDGETFGSAGEGRDSGTFPGQAADAIFSADDATSSVYVYSNTISVKRRGGWSDDSATAAASVIRNFLVHYDENRE